MANDGAENNQVPYFEHNGEFLEEFRLNVTRAGKYKITVSLTGYCEGGRIMTATLSLLHGSVVDVQRFVLIPSIGTYS
jgi:hypothetical protein